jgi:hypothetical protein
MTLVAQLMYDGAEVSADKTTRSWSQQYLIIGDGTEAYLSPAMAAGLPQSGQAHPADPAAFLRSIKIARDGDGNRWIATCEFRQEPNTEISDPCQRPWDWSRDSWSRQEPLAFAKQVVNGEPTATKQPIRNSAGDEFAKLPSVERKYPTYKLSRNFRIEDAPTEEDYQDTVNNAEIKILDNVIPIGCGLIRDIRSSKVNEFVDVYSPAGTLIDSYFGYLKVEMEIAVNLEGWTVKLVDSGFNQWDATAQKFKRIRIDHKETDVEIPLDGAGGILSDSDRRNKNFAILEFVQFESADWSGLDLPEVR